MLPTTIYNHASPRSTCQETTIRMVYPENVPRQVGLDSQAKSVICEAYYMNTTLLSWRELQRGNPISAGGGEREGVAGNENSSTT